ncbi:hypothetical protein [Rhizobacter sp. SG703]|uniref:hypothetical protein n=1 Tax=Rhizobacter sp. SG703 TaxID=2587140 RepID=UPI001446C7F6|nr:hypothetical protein [Rhizobacter sp. SG703]NKI94070.1 hypothetical protein [Rhizobacter sp. SG703]
MAAVYLPVSARQQLVTLGVITPQQAALSYDELMNLVSAVNKPLLYACYAAAVTEQALNAAQSEYQAVIDQQDLNNLSDQVWQLREKIMRAKWPENATSQNQLIALFTADIASGLPEDPPASNIPSTIDPTVIASRKATMQAQVDSATALLDALTQSTASGSTVDWPLTAGAATKFTEWLMAQGIPASDVSDTYWIGSRALSFDLTDLERSWSLPTFDPASAPTQLVQLTDNAESPLGVYDSDTDGFYAVDKASVVKGISLSSAKRWGGTVIDSLGVSRKLVPTDDAKDVASGGKFDLYPYGDSKYLVVPAGTDPSSILMKNYGTDFTFSGSNTRLWSDGTSIYQIGFGWAEAAFDVDSPDYADFQAALKAGIASGDPVTAFLGHGLTVYTGAEAKAFTGIGEHHSTWETWFEDKLAALDKSSGVLTTTLSTESARLSEQLKTFQNTCELVGKLMSAVNDAKTSMARKV